MDSYTKLLADFCYEINTDSKISRTELAGISAPCIPYTFSGYNKAALKVFYLGKETYGWRPMSRLCELYEQNDLDQYLVENNNVIASPDNMIEYSANKQNFWTFVIKLQIYLRTGEMVDDVYALTPQQKALLNEIGYGNTNSIETMSSNGIDWTKTSQGTYGQVKRYSSKLDNMKVLLDTYNPDWIVIANWEDCDDFWGNIKAFNLHQYYIDGLRAVYAIEGYETKILWTSHPRRYSFMGYNIPMVIKEMTNGIFNIKNKYDGTI